MFAEVKQSFKDANSDEVTVAFLPGDARLGLRVERRPLDDACEVTYVEPGGAAEQRGVLLDDVVLGADGREGQSYDDTLRMLTRGTRPMRLHLLRPQLLFNSPLHFKLEVISPLHLVLMPAQHAHILCPPPPCQILAVLRVHGARAAPEGRSWQGGSNPQGLDVLA